MRMAYLAALHQSGSAVPATGWQAQFVTIEHEGAMVAACPLYLKAHSWGEYVFDWAWAEAYARHGLSYYPKHLVAVPFTPVPGTRLMAIDEAWRRVLARALVDLTASARLSSLHVLYPDDTDAAALRQAGCLTREGLQFHWVRDPQEPTPDFESLLSTMQRDKRKKIRQEQRRVAEAGIRFSVHEGDAIDGASWDFFYRCHQATYLAHHGTPYLRPAFFEAMARVMPEHWVMFVAWRADQRVAASLIAVDRVRRAAWGRYWGSLEQVPCLHFDACYYQPLAWCLAQGIDRFEGGAQGEHKMARGLLPQRTMSMHWLDDERFASAVADYLAREGTGVGDYADELGRRSPFRR